MSTAAQIDRPIFTPPVRWTIRVLAWLAFGVAAYLSWHVVNQTAVAGCGVGAQTGCDIVLQSGWSKWLGVPVAVPGLACYATLAALSVLLGVKNPDAGRWINTAFLMLAVVAAVSSLWFIGIQVFAIGDYCRWCLIADACGIALGALSIWSVARWWHETRYQRTSQTAASGIMALRTAMPTASRTVPIIAAPRRLPTPSFAIAFGGAGAIVALLVGGQILRPAKSFELNQVALNETISMDGADGGESTDPAPSVDATTRVAMRVPAEPNVEESGGLDNQETVTTNREGDDPTEPSSDQIEDSATRQRNADNEGADLSANRSNNTASTADATNEAPDAASPKKRERIVSFLGGKLKLDVYKHPVIGDPEAPHVMIEMLSYDCKHCRKMHRTIKQAKSRYGNQVAIIVMVVPLEMGCNKLVTSSAGSHRGACSTARMALGVARLRPTAFARFHDWLMADTEEPPALDRIVARAYDLADRQKLRELTQTDELKKQIAGYVDLFASLGQQHKGKKQFGLPVQILGDHVMTGTVDKSSDVYKAWEQHLGVKPR